MNEKNMTAEYRKSIEHLKYVMHLLVYDKNYS